MRKNENKKQEKRQKTGETKKEKRKRGPKGVPTTRDGPKKDFHIRIVKRNRNEIEAQIKSDFEHPTKTKNMKEHERT